MNLAASDFAIGVGQRVSPTFAEKCKMYKYLLKVAFHAKYNDESTVEKIFLLSQVYYLQRENLVINILSEFSGVACHPKIVIFITRRS